MQHDGETFGDTYALFRAVNDRVREVNTRSGGRTARLADFVCECSDPGCTERLSITIDDYDAVRERPGRLLVVRGHEECDRDLVVERHDDYSIVERGVHERRSFDDRKVAV